MTKIHGIAYIIIGIFVLVISTTNEKFIVFYYVAWAFITFGAIKLIINFIKKKMGVDNAVKPKPHQRILSQQQHKVQHQQTQHLKRCTRCGNVMRLHDRFCSRCGAIA